MSGGNPFFVRELLCAPTDAVPGTVRDAVLARLMQCSPAGREVAELVSLLPGRTDLWLARTLLGDIGAGADEAVERGLLRYHEGALAFRHELGRLAVASAIPRACAQALHQSILRSLIEHNADVSQLVHHALHAQDVKPLLEYAPRAAQQAAAAGAHREAVAHLATALRFVDAMNMPERAQLLERHAAECNVTNQVAESLVRRPRHWRYGANAATPSPRRECCCSWDGSIGSRVKIPSQIDTSTTPSLCSRLCREVETRHGLQRPLAAGHDQR